MPNKVGWVELVTSQAQLGVGYIQLALGLHGSHMAALKRGAFLTYHSQLALVNTECNTWVVF